MVRMHNLAVERTLWDSAALRGRARARCRPTLVRVGTAETMRGCRPPGLKLSFPYLQSLGLRLDSRSVSYRNMRFLVFVVLLTVAGPCRSGEIDSIEKAWAYLTAPSRSDQWIVIESKKNGRYVQCANMGEFLNCPFPVWRKALPTAKRTAVKTSRRTPFPDVAGSRTREYISRTEVPLLKEAIAQQGLKPEDVFSQVVDERGRIVGTSYEIVVILNPSFSRFTSFVQHVLNAVWGGTPEDGYTIETDS